MIFVTNFSLRRKETMMSIFDFFKRKNKADNEPRSTLHKLANRYLVEYADDYFLPSRSYKITDMNNGKEFKLNVVCDFSDAAFIEKSNAEDGNYHIRNKHYKVSVSVNSKDSKNNLAFFSSDVFQKDFDLKEKRIEFNDVYLALYNQLKEARKDSSNPQKQEEAYLVSTLLRAAHDNIWIAPLLQHKEKPENSAQLEQLQLDVNEVREKVKERTQAYKQKRQEAQENEEVIKLFPELAKKEKKSDKKELSAEQMQQQNSRYIQSLMKENFVDGL